MPRIRRRFFLESSEIGVYHCIDRCVSDAPTCAAKIPSPARISSIAGSGSRTGCSSWPASSASMCSVSL